MSGQPTVDSLMQLNKLLKEAKASEDWALQFRPIDLERARIIVYSDASFANSEGLRSQAGYTWSSWPRTPLWKLLVAWQA